LCQSEGTCEITDRFDAGPATLTYKTCTGSIAYNPATQVLEGVIYGPTEGPDSPGPRFITPTTTANPEATIADILQDTYNQ
jgi:hypothetical protein